MPVFAWERIAQGWIARVSQPLLTPLTVCNFVLADEGLLLLSIPALFWFYDVPAFVIALALLASSTKVEDKLKALFKRGRPRDPNEWGIPSGDCALVSAWSPPLLGWWAALPILLVVWARLARDAHWPLDTVAGVILGLWLASPVWWWRWVL